MKLCKESTIKAIKKVMTPKVCVEGIVPITYAYFVYLYAVIFYGVVVTTFNDLVGYVSYDLSNTHTLGDNIYYDSLYAMLSVIPASSIFIFIPVFTLLGVIITVYLISLFTKENIRKTMLLLISLFISLTMNICIVFIVGLNEKMAVMCLILTIIDFIIAVYEIYSLKGKA